MLPNYFRSTSVSLSKLYRIKCPLLFILQIINSRSKTLFMRYHKRRPCTVTPKLEIGRTVNTAVPFGQKMEVTWRDCPLYMIYATVRMTCTYICMYIITYVSAVCMRVCMCVHAGMYVHLSRGVHL